MSMKEIHIHCNASEINRRFVYVFAAGNGSSTCLQMPALPSRRPSDMCIIYIYICTYTWYAPLVPRFCLISVICSGNVAFVLAKLGHQGRGVCHNSTIKNSGPKIVRSFHNLEFKIQLFKTIVSGFWNIEYCIPKQKWDSRFKISK